MIQIVIDIPDRIYKINQNRRLNITDAEILEKAVRNGTPLPKGHGRLIDAEEVERMTREEINTMKYKVCCPMCDNKKCVRGTASCEAEQWAKSKAESEKSMSEENGKVCCNCRHNIRTGEITNIKCHCDIDGCWLSYVTVMTHWCRHWSRDKAESEE